MSGMSSTLQVVKQQLFGGLNFAQAALSSTLSNVSSFCEEPTTVV